MLPDFNRLKVFYHVYRLLSISAAAEPLHLSQSAISQHIRKLEEELSTPLFTRLPRKLVPTPSGERLFALIQPFVIGLERNLQEIQAARSQPRGVLRLGAPTAFGESVLPRYMAKYRKRYPEVRFHLQLGHPNLLLPAVRKGELDFAFADIFSSRDSEAYEKRILSSFPLVEERLILVCSMAYYQERLKNEALPQAFRQLNFVAYDPFGPALRSWLKHHFGLTQIKLDIVLSVESVRAVITAVKHHLGLGVVPAHLVQTALDQGDLVCVLPEARAMINRIAVVQLSAKIPTVTEKSFIRHVEKLWEEESNGRD